MKIYRSFLLAFVLALAAPAQQVSDASTSSAPTYRLEGRVVQEPADWIQINWPDIVDAEGKMLLGARSFDRQTGAFAFSPVPAGTYLLHVSGMLEGGLSEKTQKVVVANDITDVELPLPTGFIPVIVRKESPHPVRRCWWSAFTEEIPEGVGCDDYAAAQVELVPVDSPRAPFTGGAGVLKDPTHFRMSGIQPGNYIVRVELPLNSANYIQSVTSGSLDLLHEELQVPESGIVSPIEIVVRDDFAFLRVQGIGISSQSLVVLLPEGVPHPVPQFPSPVYKRNSTFVVAPGSYSVFAFDSPKGVYSNAASLSKYEGRAVKVTLSANETKTIKVDVIHEDGTGN